MNHPFNFQPISFSWVAIHPNPKGVIQFIGGAFFGTFPTFFYHYFFRKLFEERYTIVAFPFRFSFRHWPIAISLLQEQAVLAEKIPEITKQLTCQTGLDYQTDIYQDKKKYLWIGHSLGTKYVALLEFFSSEHWREILKECTGESEKQIQWIEDR